MYTKLYKLGLFMSRLSIFLLVTIQSLSMVFADISISQGRLHEVSLEIMQRNIGLKDLLNSIEQQTDFTFAYKEKDIDNIAVKLSQSQWTMKQLLESVSVQAKLSFKRVNESITIHRVISKQGLPDVMENQEKITIEGKVIDANGESLPGATIIESGTANGVTSDIDGNFSLEVEQDAILVINFIGYETLTVSVSGKSFVEAVLKIDVQSLSEVVVVGYGTQIKENVTSAISTVKASEFLTERPITSLQNGLIGAAPGLRVTLSNGRPGTNGNIGIRGRSTFGSGGNVLVIVDGVESSLGDIDPNVVESVTVLKDAAAAAVYGSRAANGVVLITTKEGKSGDMKVKYSYNIGFQTPTMVPELVNSVDYMLMHNEARRNTNQPVEFSEEEIEKARNGELFDTDWANVLYGEAAQQQVHSLNLSGGTDKLSYLFSLGYLSQEGINVAADDYKRYNLRLKISNKPWNWFKIGTNTAITYRDQYSIPTEGGRNFRANPLYPIQLADGTYLRGDGGTSPNPVLSSNSGNFGENQRITIESQLFTKFYFSKGLTFEEKVSIRAADISSRSWRQGIDYVNMNYVDGVYLDTIPRQSFPEDNSYAVSESRSIRLITQSLLTYKKDIGRHGLNALVGFQSEEQFNASSGAGRRTFELTSLQDLDHGLEPSSIGGLNLGNTSHRSAWTMASIFGRVNYNYQSRYHLEAAFRYDGSSRFTGDNKWGFFPSISGAWNIGNEPFFSSNVSFVEVLKLRASYGQLGDASPGGIGNYDFFQTVNRNDGYSWGEHAQAGFVPGRVANPDISWETAIVKNFGLDAAFFRNKLDVVVEYFINNRVEILDGSPAVPREFGLTPPTVNGAELKSWGWEFEIGHRSKIGQVKYSVAVNYSNTSNEIIKLGPSGPNIGNSITDIGQPFGALRGYKSDGYIRDQFDLDEYKEKYDVSGIQNPYIGGIKLVDVTGDGVIDEDDMVIMDDAINNHHVGARFTTEYKGVKLSVILAGILQRRVYWSGSQVDLHFSGGIGAPFAAQKSSYNPENHQGTLNAEFPAIQPGLINYDRSDAWLKDAGYLRVRNINLSYNFQKLISKKIPGISNLNVHASVENPFILWTNWFARDTGWDPQLSVGSVNYPLARTIAFGFNVEF